MLARLNCQHTICNPAWQNVRPLIDRLVGDAYCMGSSGYSAAQQFDGFGFLHGAI